MPVRLAKRPTRAEVVARDPLGRYLVWWDDVSAIDARKFRRRLSQATREQDLQAFLEGNPILLAQMMRGGHGRWVIPRLSLGAAHETDFVVGEKLSSGYRWLAVELESPKAKMFTRAGDPTAALTHAIRQITDWRAWLKYNQNHATLERARGGLGLENIGPEIPGLILIGRRADTAAETNARREQLMVDLGIDIRSYDSLVDAVEYRAGVMDRVRRR